MFCMASSIMVLELRATSGTDWATRSIVSRISAVGTVMPAMVGPVVAASLSRVAEVVVSVVELVVVIDSSCLG
jgi:hypothetical protein